MVFAILLALSGLTLSAVAIYYSVIGLTAIFAAAFWPIVVMGTSLEVSKLVAASWLKANWERIPKFMKLYMTVAVIVLMLITSMGIFGFLSKAHSDQSLVSGDVQSKIAIYDEKINTAKENIQSLRNELKQLDAAVDQVMARSTDEKGADKSNAIRKSQQRDRARIAKEIETNQKLIASLNDEAAPIRAEIRKVEAEVGPIKYIAKFVYGDNPDANILEKAVTWVIMIIIFVFDPLAVLLLLASQMTWQWYKQDKEGITQPVYTYDTFEKPTEEELKEIDTEPAEVDVVKETTVSEQVVPTEERSDPHPVGWMYPKHANIVEYKVAEDADEELDIPVLENEETWAQRVIDEADEDVEANEKISTLEKAAIHKYKEVEPNANIKRSRRLYDEGIITELPWSKYMQEELRAQPDDIDPIERPGDYLTETDEPKKKNTYIVKDGNRQIRETKSD